MQRRHASCGSLERLPQAHSDPHLQAKSGAFLTRTEAL
jgi:hypothetical protein